MLEALGVSPLAETVYLTMLKCPDLGADGLAQRLNLERLQLSEALDDLTRNSLLLRSPDDSGSHHIIDPEVGLATLLARQRAQLARRQQEVEECRASFAALLAANVELRPRDLQPMVTQLVGSDMIGTRLQELSESCSREACALVPAGAQPLQSILASRDLDAAAVKRGVRLRTLYQDSSCYDPGTREYAHWLTELGTEVRTLPVLPLQMLIIDREIAIVPVDLDDTQTAAFMIKKTGIATALVAFYERLWRSAMPFGRQRRHDEDGISPQEKRVLQLLGEGHTDEAIARRLSISARTSRRFTARLLGRLGARSRFQAGVLALARGWINPDDLEPCPSPSPAGEAHSPGQS